MEYYTVTPPEPSKVTEALGEFLDGALDPLLQTDAGSLPIKFSTSISVRSYSLRDANARPAE